MPADFTKGTWECNFMPEGFSIKSKNKGCIITADGKYVASVQNDNDGKLIAEAPNMYDILAVLLHENTIHNTENYRALDKLLGIIERVTGDKITLTEVNP